VIFTDLMLALEEGSYVSDVEGRDYVLTHYDGFYHVLPHGSGYNQHHVLEVFRSRHHYFTRRGRR